MRTNLNSTSMRNTCPEFPLFGANYPDATCMDGILYDLDNVGDDGVLIKPLEEIPCPFCRTEEFIRYDPFNKEYSMDSEEDIRDWYMSYINEMRNKYGGKYEETNTTPELKRLAYEQMKEVNDGDSKIIRLLFL